MTKHFQRSMSMRSLILIGLATGWPAWSVSAGDRPSLVPLDAAAMAEDAKQASAPAGRSSLENRSPVVDAVYRTLEKVGVVPAGGRSTERGQIRRVANEAPAIEAHVQEKGTSSDKVKKAALAELPLDRLTPQNRGRVESVLNEVGYFRRLPTTVFAAEPEVYQFFIRYPDVAVSIWRVMGISEMKMWQTGPNEYEGDSGDGSTGTIDVMYRGADEVILICEGQYQSPMLKKPIKARSVVLLKSSSMKEADGTIYITHRADMYVAFPSQTVETVAKILSPLTGSMADRTFTEMSLFLRMMSLAMTRRPTWVDQIAGQMEGVPDLRKQQLRQVTLQVHNLERKRQGLPALVSRPATPPAPLPPDATTSAQPANAEPGTAQAGAKSMSAKPVSKTNPAGPDSTSDNRVEKKVDVQFTKPKVKLEPGFEYIPRRKQ